MAEHPRFILALRCVNRRGIVAAVTTFLAAENCNIVESQQLDDDVTGTFFMRVAFASEGGADGAALKAGFAAIGETFAMEWQLWDATHKLRALLMVSKFGHCLNDLLYRASIGALPIEIAAVVSNHEDMRPMVAAHGLPYIHIPVSAATKIEAEARLRQVWAETGSDLMVLARYMQVLSDELCRALPGQIINIHHSFLPSFKGAKPYHQAHKRGVKLIGATAHYVTGDLDEGPIIEQDVTRVDHHKSPDDLVSAGRDVETLVLARAVQWHAERRVFLNNTSTVVFR